jgi:hypothetical protein
MAEVRAGRVSFQDFEQQENRGRELGPCSAGEESAAASGFWSTTQRCLG